MGDASFTPDDQRGVRGTGRRAERKRRVLAASKGSYLNQQIRHQYNFQRIL